MGVYRGMLGLNGIALPPDVTLALTTEALVFLALGIAVTALEPRLNRLAATRLQPGPAGGLTALNTVVPSVLMVTLGTFTVMKLAEQSFSPFLYFQF